ncbi:PTS-dependent dihydroxyacetone kinase, partial [Actinomyces sp. oral taxon 178 str. F0338]
AEAGAGPAAVLEAAAAAARGGAEATEPMRATKGRASYLGERSIGHLDPGAVSSALILAEAAAAARAAEDNGDAEPAVEPLDDVEPDAEGHRDAEPEGEQP